MLTVYLAGPINKCTDAECIDWREYVKEHLPECEIRNPMDRDYRGADHTDPTLEAKVVHGDKADIMASDIVLVNFQHPSVGTSMEMLYAWQLEKTIFVVNSSGEEPLSVWLTYHSHNVFKTMDEAIAAIKKVNDLNENILVEVETLLDDY